MVASIAIGAVLVGFIWLTASHLSSRPQAIPAQRNDSHPLSNFPVRQLHAFGDSITAGYGLPAGEAWPFTLAKRLHVQFDDAHMHAVLGGAVMDWGSKAYAVHPHHGDLSVVLPGYNDVRANGDDAAKLQRYAASLGAYVTWLALADDAKQQGNDIRYLGEWHDSGIYGRETSETGGARASISGKTIYIGTWTTPQGGSFDVAVDGHLMRRVRTWGKMGNGGAASQTDRGAALVRIPGLKDRLHRIAITTVGDGPVAITWIGGSGTPSPSAPRVLLGDTLAMNASAIGHPDEAYGRYTENARRDYANVSDHLARQLQQDGLQVKFVATSSYYDPKNQVQKDGVHPNTTGRDNIAGSFADSLSPELNFSVRDHPEADADIQAMLEGDIINKPIQ